MIRKTREYIERKPTIYMEKDQSQFYEYSEKLKAFSQQNDVMDYYMLIDLTTIDDKEGYYDVLKENLKIDFYDAYDLPAPFDNQTSLEQSIPVNLLYTRNVINLRYLDKKRVFSIENNQCVPIEDTLY